MRSFINHAMSKSKRKGRFRESELPGQTSQVIKRILTLIRNVHPDKSDWSSLLGMLGSAGFFYPWQYSFISKLTSLAGRKWLLISTLKLNIPCNSPLPHPQVQIVIDDAFSLIWPYHDHVQTFKGSESWYEVVQFILSFSWNFFPPDPCFYVAKGADWKGQVRKNLLCNDYDHIISKLHRDVSAHYPPRTGIQSRRRHLVETLLLILRD